VRLVFRPTCRARVKQQNRWPVLHSLAPHTHRSLIWRSTRPRIRLTIRRADAHAAAVAGITRDEARPKETVEPK
jgi:hypothetical protein